MDRCHKNKKGSGGPLPFGSSWYGERLLGGFRHRLGTVARLDRYKAASTDSLVELDGAGFEREQRVVAAHADALAGMELGAPLPHQDIARHHDLAAEFLDAEPLAR